MSNASCAHRSTLSSTSDWQIRRSDHAFLTSQRAHEIVDHENITVIDYRPLQQAWNA
jgi:chitin disaccharide deacetylase